jgi:glycosyltransferase involved in cell wall biosynthesis
VLVEALAGLVDLDWRMTIAGSRTLSPETVAGLDARIEKAGLRPRIECIDALAPTEVAALYDRADLFVLASRYEGFGMVLVEALSHGLPIVTTRVGAAGTLPFRDAALIVPPGDVTALRAALRALIVAPDRRGRLADAAWRVAGTLPRWEETARAVARVLRTAAAPAASV